MSGHVGGCLVRGGECLVRGGGCLVREERVGVWSEGEGRRRQMAIAAVDMHPTGILSCLIKVLQWVSKT